MKIEMKMECYDCGSLENLVFAKRKVSEGKVSAWSDVVLGGEVQQSTMLCPACMDGAVEVQDEYEDTP